MKCTVPPAGWECTRPAGHEGPCAALPASKERCDALGPLLYRPRDALAAERWPEEKVTCRMCGEINGGHMDECSVPRIEAGLAEAHWLVSTARVFSDATLNAEWARRAQAFLAASPRETRDDGECESCKDGQCTAGPKCVAMENDADDFPSPMEVIALDAQMRAAERTGEVLYVKPADLHRYTEGCDDPDCDEPACVPVRRVTPPPTTRECPECGASESCKCGYALKTRGGKS